MTRPPEPKVRRRPDCAIAILGAACRLPGAPDLDAFWTLLAEGRDAVATVPADRFTLDAFRHPRRGEPGKSYTFAAGTLADVGGFDAASFGISPREAAEMDPQQRLLLEVAWRGAGGCRHRGRALAGSGTGVFVGVSLTDYARPAAGRSAGGDRYFMTGSALSHPGQPDRLPPRPARAEPSHRHRLLLLAGRRALRPARRCAAGGCGRRWPAA